MSEFNPVDFNAGESAVDDASQAPELAEALADDDISEGEPLSEATLGNPKEDASSGKEKAEPGWIKQRVDSAVERATKRAVADAEARIRAQYEPFIRQQREAEAARLVAEGEFKSKERALEYLTLKAGQQPAEQPINQPQRDDKGRFAAAEANVDPAVAQRAQTLLAQAKTIEATLGVDVMQIYRTNDAVKKKILSGEWDFTDVAKSAQKGRNVPAPIRSSNGARTGATSIMDMSDDQFDRLNENLQRGKIYDTRR